MLALEMDQNEKEMGVIEENGDEANDAAMQDFSIDELYDYGFFTENSGGEVDLSFDESGLSFDPVSTAEEEATTKIGDQRGKLPEASQTVSKKDKAKRRRQSIKIDIDKGVSPPSWHSEAADKVHRQSIVVEIAKLLQSRKKTQPTSEWVRQLPHKARKLEERLYRTAPSLEAYLDRSTLKNRLRRIATVITRQYRTAKLQQRFSHRSSASSTGTFSSFGSFAATHRDSVDSVQSMDSLRSLQKSFNQKASFPMAIGSSQVGGAATVDASSTPAGHPSTAFAPLPASDGGIQTSTSLGISELEQQKAVNEKLQQQIMENIRKQEELVRTLQARAQANAGQNGEKNDGSRAPAPSPVCTSAHSNGVVDQGSLSSLTRSSSQSQNFMSNQQLGSVHQQQNMLSLNMAQARLNPALMAQAALLNQNRGLAPILQNQLQMNVSNFTAANVIMNNNNLLQQSLGLSGHPANLSALQLQRLASQNLGANQTLLASLQQQNLQNTAAPSGGSLQATSTVDASTSQRSAVGHMASGNTQTEPKDIGSLSPGSFDW